MKRFKEFTIKKIDPVLVTAIPVHGKHAVAKDLKEDTENPKVFLKQDWTSKNSNKHLDNSEDRLIRDPNIDKKLCESQPTFNSSHQHASHVESYTIDSHKLNRYHIEKAAGKPLTDDHKVNHFERKTKALDETLKQHKLHYDVHLFHGMHHSWDLDKDASQHPERHVRMPAYLSTTHNKAIAKVWSHTYHGARGGCPPHTC